MRALILAIGYGLAGCQFAPNRLDLELEHVSHPLIGWPVDSQDETGLSQLQVIGRWDRGRWYVEQGLGYNLDARGFEGPDLLYTGRVGVAIWGKQ